MDFFSSWVFIRSRNTTLRTESESKHKRMEHVLYFIWTLFLFPSIANALFLRADALSKASATQRLRTLNERSRKVEAAGSSFETGEMFAAENFKFRINIHVLLAR